MGRSKGVFIILFYLVYSSTGNNWYIQSTVFKRGQYECSCQLSPGTPEWPCCHLRTFGKDAVAFGEGRLTQVAACALQEAFQDLPDAKS